jgi:hypothetical protein
LNTRLKQANLPAVTDEAGARRQVGRTVGPALLE